MALIQGSFMSESLTRQVMFTAIIPADGFGPPGGEQKPLRSLYLLHGYTGSSLFWLTNHALGAISSMYNLAIIMPDGENHFYTDDHIMGYNWGRFAGQELVDYTRNVFPLLSREREDTMIGGISMGGYGAIRCGLQYRETFGKIIGISSALVTDGIEVQPDKEFPREQWISLFGDLSKVPGSEHDPRHLAKQALEGGSIPDLYFACGDSDFLLERNRNFRDYLQEIAFPFTYEEGPGGHEPRFTEPYLRRGIARACEERK